MNKIKIIPAIDIKNKKCVRLKQGDFNRETIYNDNPVDMAKYWFDNGFKFLHIVDLDGAFEGTSRNFDVIEKIVKSTNLICDVGGGIRDSGTILNYLNAGAKKIVLGTKVINNIYFLEEVKVTTDIKNIIIGLDAIEDKIAVKGWTEITQTNIFDFIPRLIEYGINKIIYTDIQKDGMLDGPNVDTLTKLAETFTDVEFVQSGGISSIIDIKNTFKLTQNNITGIIIGKALYDKKIDINELKKFIG